MQTHTAEQSLEATQLLKFAESTQSALAQKVRIEKRLESVLSIILDLPVFNAGSGAIFLFDDVKKTLSMVANIGMPETIQNCCSQIQLGQCLCGLAAQNKEPLFNDPLDGGEGNLRSDACQHPQYCVPILREGGALIGMLNVGLSNDYIRSDSDVAVLQVVANTMAHAIEFAALQLKLNRYHTIVEQAPVSVVVTDTEGQIEYVNPRACELTDYPREELVGMDVGIFECDETPREVIQDIWTSIQAGKSWHGDLPTRKSDGSLFWESKLIAPITNLQNVVTNYVAIKEDITLRMHQERQLQDLATSDPITGLPNHLLMVDRLNQAISFAKDTETKICVVHCSHCSAERFTAFIDTHGKTAADHLLSEVGRRLTNSVPVAGAVGRYFGNTFEIIVPGIDDSEQIQQILEKIRDGFSAPLSVAGDEIPLDCCLGVSLFPRDGNDATTLFRKADIALPSTGARDGNPYVFYDDGLGVAVAEEVALTSALKKAVDRKEFLIHYQPKVSLTTGKMVGAEALIRWLHPEKGLIPPDKFIRLAEMSGDILGIGQWVLEEVCRQVHAWKQAGLRIVPVAVNISAHQLRDQDLVPMVERVLKDNDLAPQYLELELTESILIDTPEQAERTLNQLAALGVTLALDDFGTGYSSLSYLNRFPFDRIKIDRTFIQNATTRPTEAAIVRAVLSMGHSMGYKVTAEGVETEGQLRYLLAHDCDEMQGYYFSKPLATDAFEDFLRSGTSLPDSQYVTPANQRTLLLLDDEPHILAALKRILRRHDYHVLATTDPSEAFDLLAQHRVGVICSDQRMQKVTGTEFLSRVKELYPDTVRMILSGYTDTDTIIKAINEGSVYRFITKPWENDHFLATIDDAFHYQELARENAEYRRGFKDMCNATLIEMRDDHRCGITEIDTEHQMLFDLYNQLCEAVFDTRKVSRVIHILEAVTDFLITHNENEEHLMEEHNYPGANLHIAAHTRIVTLLEKAVRDCRAGITVAIPALLAFIRSWIDAHIEYYDRQLGEYLTASGT